MSHFPFRDADLDDDELDDELEAAPDDDDAGLTPDGMAKDYEPLVGEAWDPYADQPDARREALRPLLLGDDGEAPAQVLNLLQGDADEKLAYLLGLPNANQVVQALSADEFALLAKDIGVNDASDLLALASPRQLQSLVDLDAWQGGELQPESVLTWLAVAREAGIDTLDTYVAAQEDGLLCLTLAKKLRVVANHAEVEQELPDDMEIFDSPDGSFKIMADPDEVQVPLLRDLIDTLYRINLLRGRAILRSMTWELSAQLEDDLAQLRAARLDTLGFAEQHEALQLYAYEDPHAKAAELQAHWRGSQPGTAETLRPYVPEDEPARVGLALPSDALQGSFLAQVMARLPTVERERLAVAMVRLSYRVQSARASSPLDLAVLPQWSRHAVRTAAMGLEHVSGGDLALATVILAHEPLTALFNCGHSLTIIELHRGRRLRAQLGGPDGIDLLEPDDAALLRAVTGAFPMRADGELTRPFETLHELAAVRDRLRGLQACAQLMARLAGGDLRHVRDLAPRKSLPRLTTLLNTAIAWHVLQGHAELRPLDADSLRAFLRQAMDGRQLRPALRTAVVGGLLSRVDLSDQEVVALQDFVEHALDRLGDELGGLTAAVAIDVRFAGDAVWLNAQ